MQNTTFTKMQNTDTEDKLHFNFSVYGASKNQDVSLPQFIDSFKEIAKTDLNL